MGLNALCSTLEQQNGWRVDYSFNGVTTQSETTRRILDALTEDVHIYALFSSGQEDLQLIEVLNRYAAAETITDVWVWYEAVGANSYLIYIGYA